MDFDMEYRNMNTGMDMDKKTDTIRVNVHVSVVEL